MRKVVLGVAVSLDGYIEGPNGEYDWCFTDQDYGMSAFFESIDSIFMGRKSYDVSKAAEGQDPSAQNPWSHMTTYVFSNSLKQISDKGVQLVSGDVVEAVRKLKAEKGKNIWLFGGAKLTSTFINEGLVDEFWLSVHPVLLGAGTPLFQKIGSRKNLKLIDHRAYDTGLVSLKYEPA